MRGNEENPYAISDLPPLRGYWSRFRTALGRAAKFHRNQMRREGISVREEIVAWLMLLLLLCLSIGLIAVLLFYLFRYYFGR